MRAVCPLEGVSVGKSGDSSTVRVDYRADATDQQKEAAQAALASFDWSDAAQDAWQEQQDRSRAIAALLTESGYFAVGVRAAIYTLFELVNDERESRGLPRLTKDEIVQKIGQTVSAGEADPI